MDDIIERRRLRSATGKRKRDSDEDDESEDEGNEEAECSDEDSEGADEESEEDMPGPYDEEDEDDIEAHEASIQRLKEADDATRQMTREEYQHYSDCRQASFTYRKCEHSYTFSIQLDSKD